jgi:hypothetical protein
MSVQKAIIPGMFLGIIFLIGFTSVLLKEPAARLANSSNPASVFDSNVSAVVQPVGGCSISRSYPDSVRQWCGLIDRYSRENGLDPNLVSAVMLQESAGKPDAYSKSGAVGLMQVMPRDGKASRFVCKNGPCFTDRPSMEELFDPEYNVAYGTRMLSELIQRRGSVREALKSYGPMDVGYYYADLVLSTMNKNR